MNNRHAYLLPDKDRVRKINVNHRDESGTYGILNTCWYRGGV